MDSSEINILIAKWCGWKAVSVYEWKDGVRLPMQYHWDGFKATGLPNYFGDLNAIHEALKSLPYQEQPRYLQVLTRDVLMKDEGVSDWDKHMAEAPQRCEALLRTIGKWKE